MWPYSLLSFYTNGKHISIDASQVRYRLLLFYNTLFNLIHVYGWLKKILNKKLKNICQNEFINKSDLLRQNLITYCIWYKVKMYLLKHCVLNLLSEMYEIDK